MAAFFVNSAVFASTSGPFPTYTPISGNLLIVTYTWDPSGLNTPTITSVADGQGTTFNTITTFVGTATSSGTGTMNQTWYGFAATGGAGNPTPTWSGTAPARYVRSIAEFNGLSTTSTVIAFQSGTSTTGPAINTTVGTTAKYGDLLYVEYGQESNSTAYTGSSNTTAGTWSAVTSVASSGGNTNINQSQAFQYKVLTGANASIPVSLTIAAGPTAGGYNVVAFTSLTSYPAKVGASLSTSASLPNYALVNFLRQTSGSISFAGSGIYNRFFYYSQASGSIFLDNGTAESVLTYLRLASGLQESKASGSLIPQIDYVGPLASTSLSFSSSSSRFLYFYPSGVSGNSASLSLVLESKNTYFDNYPRSGTGAVTLTSNSISILKFRAQSSGSLTLAGVPLYAAYIRFILSMQASLGVSGSSAVPRQFIPKFSASASLTISGSNTGTLLTSYFIGWGRPL